MLYKYKVILSFCVSVCRVLSPGVVRELTHVEHLRSYNGLVLFPVSEPCTGEPGRHLACATGAPGTRMIVQKIRYLWQILFSILFHQIFWKFILLKCNDVTILTLKYKGPNHIHCSFIFLENQYWFLKLMTSASNIFGSLSMKVIIPIVHSSQITNSSMMTDDQMTPTKFAIPKLSIYLHAVYCRSRGSLGRDKSEVYSLQ